MRKRERAKGNGKKIKLEANDEVELKKILRLSPILIPGEPKYKSSNLCDPKLPYLDEHTDKMVIILAHEFLWVDHIDTGETMNMGIDEFYWH